MQFDRYVQVFFQHAYQVVGIVRCQKAGHVLDADRIDAHFFQFTGYAGKRFQRVDGADGIDQGSLHVNGFRIFCRLDGRFHVARVVEGIEYADDVDAVIDSAVDKFVYHVVGIMAVSQYILSPEQHLQGRLLHVFLDGPQPFPRVFVEEAHTRIKSSAAPAFQGIVADVIHCFQHGQHLPEPHPCRRYGLVAVAEHRFCNLYLSHSISSIWFLSYEI